MLKKPENPCFSSGPCAKYPGWKLSDLNDTPIGRSHRSKISKSKLQELIDKTRSVLNIPKEYRIGIMPGSDTGTFEAALWSMIGAKGVDILSWGSFSYGWSSDIIQQLKFKDVRDFKAEYGELPDLSQVKPDRDIVFTWNGTTSGVKVPDGNWIPENRTALTFCDATSAVFSMDLPWDKLDVTTWSWQKVIGGEAAHGIIVLSPSAVERLESYVPPRPLPKVFRMTSKGKLNEGIFKGSTINTPSMLCVEDALASLNWMEKNGGLKEMIARSENNLSAIKSWVKETNWISFLAKKEETISNTSICLTINNNPEEEMVKKMISFLEEENAAYDIGSHRDAPLGIRIWGGSTVETSDIKSLLSWLDLSYDKVFG